MNRRKLIVIAGMPGCGKSTLMVKSLEAGNFEACKPYELISAEFSEEENLFVLGVYETGIAFPGSDKLSMAVQPKAIEFANSTKSNILVEGDRLSTVSFFEAILENDDIEFEVIYLYTDKKTLESRYKERGSDQSQQFLNGRATKYSNILSNDKILPHIVKFENNDLDDQKVILDYLTKRFTYDKNTPKFVEQTLEDLM